MEPAKRVIPIKEIVAIPLNKGINKDELNRLLTTAHTPRLWCWHRWVYWRFHQKRHRVCSKCHKKQMEESGTLGHPGDGWAKDSVFTS